MLSPKIKKKIIQFAKECTAKNDPYHGMKHLNETAKIALWLGKKESADLDICWAAAMLHDICKGEEGDHAINGAKKAKEFLLSIGLTSSFAERVYDTIYFHNKEFHDGSIERKILWDSDKFPLMNPAGFKNRMVPFWISKLGEEEGKKRSIYEYYFYKQRFHTKTAASNVDKHTKQLKKYFKTMLLMRFVKIPKKKAEKVRLKLIAKGAYAEGYKVVHKGNFVYFPVVTKLKSYTLVKMQPEKFEKTKTLEELLAGVLTKTELDSLITSFDMIGDIAIVEVPAQLENKEKQIAEAILATNKRLKVVAKKLGKVESEFRVRPLKVIAGENRTETLYIEHGCRMKLDVAKVYFSVRLSNERKRIAELVKPGEHILALFSGVGPFPLVISKKQPTARIIAIELNPEGVKYMKENIALNKANNIIAESGDAREVVFGKYRDFADRILMPLPRTADEFLDIAFAGARDGCIVHIYSFGPVEDAYSRIEQRIAEEARKAGAEVQIMNKKIVRPFAPKVVQVVVDFKVIKQVNKLF